MNVLIILLSIIFLCLSLIHLNWAIGGKWGFDNALPTNEKGERVLNPRKIDSAIVGVGLLFFAIFYFLKLEYVSINYQKWINYMGWIIPIIFILRAIGDLKYVGFFKRIKTTKFARLDTKYYSPLCLLIGVIGIIIALI